MYYLIHYFTVQYCYVQQIIVHNYSLEQWGRNNAASQAIVDNDFQEKLFCRIGEITLTKKLGF